jgi:hypothetical protein
MDRELKRFEFQSKDALVLLKKIAYSLASKPAAPLPQGMRNSVGFFFSRGFVV